MSCELLSQTFGTHLSHGHHSRWPGSPRKPCTSYFFEMFLFPISSAQASWSSDPQEVKQDGFFHQTFPCIQGKGVKWSKVTLLKLLIKNNFWQGFCFSFSLLSFHYRPFFTLRVQGCILSSRNGLFCAKYNVYWKINKTFFPQRPEGSLEWKGDQKHSL